MKRRWRRRGNGVLYTEGNPEIILTVARDVRSGSSLNNDRLTSSWSLQLISLIWQSSRQYFSCSLSRGRLVWKRTCLDSLERGYTWFKISDLSPFEAVLLFSPLGSTFESARVGDTDTPELEPIKMELLPLQLVSFFWIVFDNVVTPSHWDLFRISLYLGLV